MSKILVAAWLLVLSFEGSASASCISPHLISASALGASAAQVSFVNLTGEIAGIAAATATPYEGIKARLHALIQLEGNGVPFSAVAPLFDQTLLEMRKADLQPTEQFDTLAALGLAGAAYPEASDGLTLLKKAESIAWSYPAERFAGPHPEEGARLKGADLGRVMSYYLLYQDLSSATGLAAKMREAGFANFVAERALQRSAALELLKAGDIAGYEAIMQKLVRHETLDYASLPDFTVLLSERLARKADISKITPLLAQAAHQAITAGDIAIVGYAANTLLDYHREDEAFKLMHDAEAAAEPKRKGDEAGRRTRNITRLSVIAKWYAAHGKPDEAIRLLAKARGEADTLDINGVTGQWALSEIAETYVNIGDMFTAALVARSLSDEQALRVRAAMGQRHIRDGNTGEACGIAIEVTKNAASAMALHAHSYSTLQNAPALALLISLATAQAKSGDDGGAREALVAALALARPAANPADKAGAIAQIANAAYGLGLIGTPQPYDALPGNTRPRNPQPSIAQR